MALTNGLVVMTPTSTAVTGAGSSATINSDGSVTFTSCATLSLNGVFTASYDNYMITMRSVNTAGDVNMRARLRLAGTDSTSTADYNDQYIYAADTTVLAARTTTNGYWTVSDSGNDQRDGMTMYVFGPALAQPTAFRSVSVIGLSNAALFDFAGTHEQSTAYDGITFYPASNAFTGLVTVFGFNQ